MEQERSIRARVDQEKIKLFFGHAVGNMSSYLVATTLIGILLLLAKTPTSIVTIWWVTSLVMAGLTIWSEASIKKKKDDPHTLEKWIKKRLFLGSINIILVGITPFLLPDSVELAYELYLFIMCTAFVTFAIIAITTVPIYVYIINFGSLGPITLYFLVQGDTFHLLLAFTAVLWQFITIKKSSQVSATAVQAIWRKEQLNDEIKERKKAQDTIMEMTISKIEAERIEAELLSRKMQIAKEAAESANRSKSEFLANMSHELRTPLNSVLGFTELLSSIVTEEKQKSYVNAIITSGKSLLTLINDILDLSKIESGKLEFQYHSTSIQQLVDELKTVFSLKINQNRIEFINKIDPRIPQHLLLDEVRVRQILFNLIGNAVKFTENGTVSIFVNQVGIDEKSNTMDLTITVKDTGIGINEADQQVIFEAFHQQGGLDTRKYGGTGLGLAISKRLTEMMGGTIDLTSKPGKGTTFEIKLSKIKIPILVEKSPDNEPHDVPDIQFKPAKILVVDDIDSNRALIVEFLNGSKLNILTANNGQEALLFVEEHMPDLVLMDLKMPVMNGAKATKKLKSNERYKHIPIIALTASHAINEEGFKETHDFDGFLSKPVSQAALFKELSRFLAFTATATIPQKSRSTDFSTKLPPKSLKRLPELIKILDDKLLSDWEQLQKKQPISDTRNFATLLTEVGSTFEVAMVEEFGKTLNRNISNFEIVNIRSLLAEFPLLVEQIKKQEIQ